MPSDAVCLSWTLKGWKYLENIYNDSARGIRLICIEIIKVIGLLLVMHEAPTLKILKTIGKDFLNNM